MPVQNHCASVWIHWCGFLRYLIGVICVWNESKNRKRRENCSWLTGAIVPGLRFWITLVLASSDIRECMGRASAGYSGVWEDSIGGAFLPHPRMAELRWKTDSFSPFDLIFPLKKTVIFVLMRSLSVWSVRHKTGAAGAMEKLSPPPRAGCKMLC